MKILRRLSVVLPFVVALACGSERSAAPEGPQRVAVTVSASGYEPSEIAARAGQPLTLVFTRTSDDGCGQRVVIPAEDIERDLPLNEAVEITLTPREPGTLRFTCGMDMYDGSIVVQ